MPAPKNAAKNAPVSHADPKHHEGKDLRRAYEHLGRVEILQRSSGQTNTDVSTLAALAQQELRVGHAKGAADLLRAAEHLSFAALRTNATEASELSPMLKEAIQKEFDHLLEKAEEHWKQGDKKDRHADVATLYRSSLEAAEQARKQGLCRQALELARSAEALAHVRKHGSAELAAGKAPLKFATC